MQCSSSRIETHKLYLSLGSNQGDRHTLLQEAISLLGQRVGVIRYVSSFLETEPWGFSSPHKFLNACLLAETSLSPGACLLATQEIERELGRTQKSQGGIYHDRPIDIDLLCFDNRTMDIEVETPNGVQRLTLPHPHMQERDFVMIPLQEVYDMEEKEKTEKACKE